MDTGVILRSTEKKTALQPLAQYKPDYVILDINTPTETSMIELFSRLEIPTFPMVQFGMVNPVVLADILQQAFIMLETSTVYLKVHQAKSEIFESRLQELVSILAMESSTRPRFYLNAPPSHFLNGKSFAAFSLQFIKDLGLEVHACFQISNSTESLSIFKNSDFLKLLRADEYTQFDVQSVFTDISTEGFGSEIKTVLNWARTTSFWSMDLFVWFIEKFLEEKQAVAKARIIKDRTSAWFDNRCRVQVSRKLNIGDPDLRVVEILPGGIGRLLEGDYIILAGFDVEKM